MQNILNEIDIRPLRSGDGPFIYSTWLRGLYYGNDWANRIEKDIFYSHYKQIINALILKGNTRVACLKEDNDVILGYATFRGTVLDWVFVKQAWRKMGIAKALVPSNINSCSHLTNLAISLKPKEWTFNPFLD